VELERSAEGDWLMATISLSWLRDLVIFVFCKEAVWSSAEEYPKGGGKRKFVFSPKAVARNTLE
jgi:hypothetical protein